MVVPIPARTKRPVAKGWPDLRIGESEVGQHFKPNDNIGLILGEPSGWLIDVDLDCEEARELADQYLPATGAITGRPSAPKSHRWYIAEGAKTEKHTDPQSNAMIVELRSTGGQTVIGPSVHPGGEPYEAIDGDPAVVPAPMLTACVKSLAEAVVKKRHGDLKHAPQSIPERSTFESDSDVERRAIAYLDAMPPAISGSGGHSACYTAATALVHGFALPPERAMAILEQHYNPRCDPPWSIKELQHKVDDAANKPHERPYGWLRESSSEAPKTPVDISKVATTPKPSKNKTSSDPGPIPTELLRIPGFVSEVMDHSLKNAPYPNQPLAFAAALALQAFLAGRKVRDQADNRTNIYLLGLAYASVGKEWPRKLNSWIVEQIGLSKCMGDGIASGEGIQDALASDPSMLFQTDEIDGLLLSINRSKDGRHEYVLNTLLRLYSASNGVFPMRHKAEKGAKPAIDQPSLVLYGTAIPNHYYAALSERMLTNGFFARTIVLESGVRSDGQEPGTVDSVAKRVLETAKWWADFKCGSGNLNMVHPSPATIGYTDDALAWLQESRRECDRQYANCESRGDPVGTTVWGRVNENSRKLALLHAISEDHLNPIISIEASKWATSFVMHLTRRMLYMAEGHTAETPFHAECLKFMRLLEKAPEHCVGRRDLMRSMRLKANDFEQVAETLLQQEKIVRVTIDGKKKSIPGYQAV